jgi:hypothetical protein
MDECFRGATQSLPRTALDPPTERPGFAALSVEDSKTEHDASDPRPCPATSSTSILCSRRHTRPLTANVKRNFQFQLRAVLVGMGGTGGTGGTTRGNSCLKGNRQGEQGGTGPILRTISVPPVPLRGSTLIRHFSFEYPLFPPELEASPQPTAAQLLLG